MCEAIVTAGASGSSSFIASSPPASTIAISLSRVSITCALAATPKVLSIRRWYGALLIQPANCLSSAAASASGSKSPTAETSPWPAPQNAAWYARRSLAVTFFSAAI